MLEKKLTLAQRILIEENYDIVETVLDSVELDASEKDKLKSQLQFDFTTAAINFSGNSNDAFRSYATKCLRKSLRRTIK